MNRKCPEMTEIRPITLLSHLHLFIHLLGKNLPKLFAGNKPEVSGNGFKTAETISLKFFTRFWIA